MSIIPIKKNGCILAILFFLFMQNASIGQRLFLCDSTIIKVTDSIKIKSNCNYCFSILDLPQNKYDSLMVDFQSFRPENLKIIYKESLKTQRGLYQVFYRDSIIYVQCEFFKRRPSGIFQMYEATNPKNPEKLLYEVNFLNGKRNGWYNRFDWYSDSIIKKILYRNGKPIDSVEKIN